MVSLFGNPEPKNDVVIFGHNYTCDLKDGIRRICAEGKCIQVRNISLYPLKYFCGTETKF